MSNVLKKFLLSAKIIGSVALAFVIFKALGLTKPYNNIGDNTFFILIISGIICTLGCLLKIKQTNLLGTIIKYGCIGMASASLTYFSYSIFSNHIRSLDFFAETLIYTAIILPIFSLSWVLGAMSGFFLYCFNVAHRAYNSPR